MSSTHDKKPVLPGRWWVYRVPPPSNPASTPTPTNLMQLLHCGVCGKLVQNDEKLLIAHFLKCQQKPEEQPQIRIISPRPEETVTPKNIKTYERKYPKKPPEEQPLTKEITPKNTTKYEHLRKFDVDHIPYASTRHKPLKTFQLSSCHQSLIRVFTVKDPVPIYKALDHLPSNAYRCPVCRRRFGSASIRNKHVYSHVARIRARTTHFTVHKLSKYLTLSCSWKKGSRRDDDSESICQRRFRSLIDLQHHRLSHTTQLASIKRSAFKRWKAGVGKYAFKSRWMIGLRKLYECPHCPKKYNYKYNYKRHLLLENSQKGPSQMADSSKTRLDSLISSYAKGYSCPEPQCLQKKMQKFPSGLHLRIHTRKDHVKETKRSITRQPEVLSCKKCVVADPTLYNSGGLTNHNKLCHKEIQCPECSELCIGQLVLNQHLEIVHQKPIHNYEKSFVCRYPECGRTFISARAFKSHVASHQSSHQQEIRTKIPRILQRPQKCQNGTTCSKRGRPSKKQEFNQQSQYNSLLDELDIEIGVQTIKEEEESQEDYDQEYDYGWSVLPSLKQEEEDVDRMGDEASSYDPLA